jgi:O-antigen ligase
VLDWALRVSIAGITASVVVLGHTGETLVAFYAVLAPSLSVYLLARGERLLDSLFDYLTSRAIAWRWGFVLWAVLSLFWTSRGDLAVTRAVTLLEIQALGLVFYDASRRLALGRWIAGTVFVSAAAATLHAMITDDPATTGRRLTGLFGNPNMLAIVGIVGLAVFCSGALRQRKAAVTALSYLGSLLLLIGVLASASLKGLAGTMSLLLTTSWLPGARRRMWATVAFVAVSGGLILSAVAPLRTYWEQAVRRVGIAVATVGMSVGTNESLVERARFIRKGWSLVAESPLAGRGLESFRWLSSEGVYAHNNYIELGVSLGLVGVVLYYGLPVRLLLSAGRSHDRVLRNLVLIAIPTLLVLDVALVSYYAKITSLLFIVLAGWAEGENATREAPCRRDAGH